jgi:DNA excision repair protein ERCC-3
MSAVNSTGVSSIRVKPTEVDSTGLNFMLVNSAGADPTAVPSTGANSSAHRPVKEPGKGIAGKPLIVQSDGTLLLEVTAPGASEARDILCCFAHLESSPEYIHSYRITPLSLWNAAAAGVTVEWIEEMLRALSRYPVPELVLKKLHDLSGRYGKTRLRPYSDQLLELNISDPYLCVQLKETPELKMFWVDCLQESILVRRADRGALKQALIALGYPCEDLCGYASGRSLAISFLKQTKMGFPFELRPYQKDAVRAFHADGGAAGGAGVIVLPCGAGKTAIGMGAMAELKTSTLIVSTNTVAVRQWRNELLDKTSIACDEIGEYTGDKKEIRPVTITTYQMLTHRQGADSEFPHLHLLKQEGWGLIIYDEVHTLPAPVFRATAEIQARRRLGLTATLVREDGREADVFALIGPKRYELPWKVLEHQGYIAEAGCYEIRVELPDDLRMQYALADKRDRFRIAAENPEKIQIVTALLEANPEDSTLVIGQYIEQLELLSRRLKLPLITGKTPNALRERLYDEFRQGKQRVLIVSKVANFAIDLPDASLAIQVSGTFGSRQEEAQRLGRLLRPKAKPSRFYSIVSKDTTEQDFASNRQLFLVEQGYSYRIVDWDCGESKATC